MGTGFGAWSACSRRLEQDHKRDHELVSVVTNVVHHVLDQLPNHEVVAHQSFTPDGQVSEPGVHVLAHVELENKREHVLVSAVMNVVDHALDHLPKYENVV